MRICPLCEATYEDDIEFCFKDGTPLEPLDREQDERPSSAFEEYSVNDSVEFLPPEAAALTGELDSFDEQSIEDSAHGEEPSESGPPPVRDELSEDSPGIQVVPGAMTSPLDDDESIDASDPFAIPVPTDEPDQPEDVLALVSGELPARFEKTTETEPGEVEPKEAPPGVDAPPKPADAVDEPDAPAPTVEPPDDEDDAAAVPPPPTGEADSKTAWLDDVEDPGGPAVAPPAEDEPPAEVDPLYATIEPLDGGRKKGVVLWVVLGVAAVASLLALGWILLQADGGGDDELAPTEAVLNVDHSPEERPTPRRTDPTPADIEDGVTDEETPGEDPTDGEEPTEAIDEEQPTPEEPTPGPEEPTPEPPTPEPPTPEPPTPEPPTPAPADDGTADAASTNPWLTPTNTEPVTAPATDATNPWSTATTQPQTGKVTVSSAPVGATFFVDSQLRGTSPLTVDVPFGHHTVRVEMDGYVPQERGISVQSGTVFVDFTLEKAVAPTTGKLTVHTNPQPGATLYVDGTSRGKTPITLDINPGVHTLRVELAGFPTKEETIDLTSLQPGENRRRVISME